MGMSLSYLFGAVTTEDIVVQKKPNAQRAKRPNTAPRIAPTKVKAFLSIIWH